jgi:hypothetical protein
MNTTTQEPTVVQPHPSTPVPSNDSNRCQYRYSNGKRCRLSSSNPRFGLCSLHFTQSNPASPQPQNNDAEDLSADLLPELSEFSSGTDILKFLARLLVLVTKGKISPRRASVLAYITNQLLHSHRAITLETKPAEEQCQRIIIDMPQPKHDDWPDHAPPSHPVMPWLRPNPDAPSS